MNRGAWLCLLESTSQQERRQNSTVLSPLVDRDYHASRPNVLNVLWCKRSSSSYPGGPMHSMTLGAVNKLFTSVRLSYPVYLCGVCWSYPLCACGLCGGLWGGGPGVSLGVSPVVRVFWVFGVNWRM